MGIIRTESQETMGVNNMKRMYYEKKTEDEVSRMPLMNRKREQAGGISGSTLSQKPRTLERKSDQLCQMLLNNQGK